MRKILFSGKRMDNGEWVEGSLLRFTDGSAMIMPSNSMAYVPKGKNVFCSAECYEIDTETVGEYTGGAAQAPPRHTHAGGPAISLRTVGLSFGS